MTDTTGLIADQSLTRLGRSASTDAVSFDLLPRYEAQDWGSPEEGGFVIRALSGANRGVVEGLQETDEPKHPRWTTCLLLAGNNWTQHDFEDPGQLRPDLDAIMPNRLASAWVKTRGNREDDAVEGGSKRIGQELVEIYLSGKRELKNGTGQFKRCQQNSMC